MPIGTRVERSNEHLNRRLSQRGASYAVPIPPSEKDGISSDATALTAG